MAHAPVDKVGGGAAMSIAAANRAYERWLRQELGGAVVHADLKLKHIKMAESPFAFLRATYWRWAETILTVCPDVGDAPAVLAVGDMHLENFGTWTDKEGRICWGVNDYDEAATMPYILDLIRLAASAALAPKAAQLPLASVCEHLHAGYARGLERPEACVLDRRHLWLRERLVVDEKARSKFWRKIDEQHEIRRKRRKPEQPPQACLDLFALALPEPVELAYWRHTAGTGSLGRPRWLGYGHWRGGPLLREAKALVPSGWVRAHGGSPTLRLNEIAGGVFRAPDPWYRAKGPLLIRRLSPNNRKLVIESRPDVQQLMHPHLLEAMGRDLAAVHLATAGRRDAVHADFKRRKARWWRTTLQAAAAFVTAEFAERKKYAK
ncbi:MAG TPA: DUF2252 family protein [Pseudolabrys sp.]|nr:DUF2252 family protein [Pseudolabrys sp.]